jgi:hypothetical protein
VARHFIEKCEHCDTVIAQCRCPAKDKVVKLSICDKCAKSIQKFEIICDDLRLEPTLLAGLLHDYFEKMKYPVTKISVKEI